jgi:hypothetical protein
MPTDAVVNPATKFFTPLKTNSLPSTLSPQETFVVSASQQQVTECSSRSGQLHTDKFSASAAIGLMLSIGQQSATNLPFTLER